MEAQESDRKERFAKRGENKKKKDNKVNKIKIQEVEKEKAKEIDNLALNNDFYFIIQPQKSKHSVSFFIPNPKFNQN